MASREKVVVAMSGGVDSSVAAGLLHEQGYDVVGLFMRTGVETPAPPNPASSDATSRSHQGCSGGSHAADAQSVAGILGIPFQAMDFREDFDAIIDYFAAEYAAGRTPNPCIICNSRLKFGKLLEYADAVGARFVATGHYARIGTRGGEPALCRARDAAKDQSYALFGLNRSDLGRVRFSVGELTKPQVRAEAQRLGLPVSDKPDSVEICFVPDDDYARVVRQRHPEAFVPGNVVDAEGRVLGRHEGVPNFTIGQRRGLGIAAGRPIYVTRVDVTTQEVTVGDADRLLSRTLVADRTHYLADVPDAFRADVKIRYLHTAAPATVERLADGAVRVVFDEPQRAVTPGQAVVFYDGDMVLGGGWITRAGDSPDD
ncbi:MAG: tRNA 2-thiouridine(34) synthase MnmA [Phycisphaerae bacterium]|nr:tRNA 2-thiouridine(34) synthase MnmA [Phycisphaerae bacterium]